MLSPEEINALREEELNENFFKALSYVQEIHANCKVLLRTHHQSEPRMPLKDYVLPCWFRADGHDWLCIKKELMSAYAEDGQELTNDDAP
ncbi:hypothetical protein RIF29_39690 [Crotalaria pallida]|uniref:Uncharacterized protein n=1 Tax=Crotalaria pallida TaxID=3830 RepID=A0AAN9HQY6_CROPI